ncbi:MAG: MFS transporter [Hasllibacter sp.]
MLLTRNRNFRLLFSASAVTNLGDGISALAFPWLATLLTDDPFLIGAVAAARTLPWLLVSVPVGTLVDRADRRRVILGADAARTLLTMAVVALAVGVPAGTGDAGPVLTLAALAFALGLAEVLRDNAAQSFLPQIVARADLEDANGQLWSAEEVATKFLGPPLAGLLIAWSVPAPFLVDAATFAVAAAMVWLIAAAPAAPRARAGFWRETRQGLAWLRANPFLLRLALLLGAINFTFAMPVAMFVLLMREGLGLAAPQVGVLLACGAGGGALGGVLGGRIVRRFGPTRCARAATVLFVAEAALPLTGVPALVALGLFATAFGSILWNIVTVSYRQRTIPPDLLGRVNGIYRWIGWGAIPLGAVAAGALVAALEGPLGRSAALWAPWWIASAAALAIAAYAFAALRFAPPADR